MSAVGVEKNFVDTQGVSLTNIEDNLKFTQLTNVDFQIDHNVTKHQLTDDTVDNVFSLYVNYIECNITLTTPEMAALVALTVDVNGVKPVRDWTLTLNDSDNQTINISLNGQIKTLRIIDSGISVVKLFIRIEGDEFLNIQ